MTQTFQSSLSEVTSKFEDIRDTYFNIWILLTHDSQALRKIRRIWKGGESKERWERDYLQDEDEGEINKEKGDKLNKEKESKEDGQDNESQGSGEEISDQSNGEDGNEESSKESQENEINNQEDDIMEDVENGCKSQAQKAWLVCVGATCVHRRWTKNWSLFKPTFYQIFFYNH